MMALSVRAGFAQVPQTDAAQTPLPQPVSSAELSLVDDSWAWNANTDINQDATGANLNPKIKYSAYYAPPSYPQFVTGDAINLSGLFKWRGEAIDPVKDARTAPGYFSAKCGFSGQLVLMGDNCQVKLGWYNVTDPTKTTPPSPSEIYPFVDAAQASLNCTQEDGKTAKTDGFCPLAWDNKGPRQLGVVRWTPKTFSSGDISKDPRYKGGYIAFAVIGAASGACTQTKYSVYEHNQRNSDGVPWVTSLVYESTRDANGFYLAFEGEPMPASDWKSQGADGDFNDLVYYVSGLTCDGGNKPCSTGLLGACSVGTTRCAVGNEAPECRPVLDPRAEQCDNVDNDCNGLVDDGEGLCADASKPNCFHGACVASCNGGGFTCPIGLTCGASGICIDPVCDSVTCQAGNTCKNGQCVDACSGVLCPYGSVCELGQCVDPCYGVTCPGDRVCELGACVANCACRGCDAGLTCSADGRCTDTACSSVSCPAGETCELGACVDPCAGITCPNGGVCSQGVCSTPMTGTSGAGGGISFGGSSATAGRSSGGEAGEAAAGDTAAGDAGAAGEVGPHSAGGASSAGAASSHGGAPVATGGSTSAGGAAGGTAPEAAAQKSSGCGFAAGKRKQTESVAVLLGLALGATWLRRRRRA